MAKKLEDDKKERIENAFKVKPSAGTRREKGGREREGTREKGEGRRERILISKLVGGGGQPLHLPFTIPAPFHFHTRDRYDHIWCLVWWSCGHVVM